MATHHVCLAVNNLQEAEGVKTKRVPAEHAEWMTWREACTLDAGTLWRPPCTLDPIITRQIVCVTCVSHGREYLNLPA